MKKYIYLLVLLVQIVFGQSPEIKTDLPTVVPPSPEAASLFKFNEMPVSLNTGMHNTSIPLVEINADGLSIPITISYHSRGVQVSEIASRVGTGWALNYGGMISRQIRDKADESTYGYFGTMGSGPNLNSTSDLYIGSNASLNRENLFNPDVAFGDTNPEFADAYPDKFMINTNFFSGEFYFDKNNTAIITQKFSDIKITPEFSDGKITGFEVVDNLGNVYSFGGIQLSNSESTSEYEKTINSYTFSQNGLQSSNGTNGELYNSSWFLRKIVTNKNETIDFIYDNEVTSFHRRNGDSDTYSETVYDLGHPEGIQVTNPYACHFSYIYSYQKILKEIRFKRGKVKFVNSLDTRLDVNGGHSLSKIEMYNIKGELVKNASLNYFYTTAPNTTEYNQNINPNSVLLNDDFARKRMFLQSVSFTDSLNTVEQKYEFEYDTQVLPSRHSNSIDFWGYYNGKNRGAFINYDFTELGDGAVDPSKVEAGLLKKIIYPTGGFSEFEYEPNIVLNRLPLYFYNIENETPITPPTGTPYGLEILNPNPIVNNPEMLSIFNQTEYNASTGRYERNFTVSNLSGNFAKSNITLSNSDDFTCKLINNDTNTTILLSVGVNTNVPIQNGSYTLVVDPRDPSWNPSGDPNDPEFFINNNFVASISYENSLNDYHNIIWGPGNRIKKISHFTSDASLEYSKVYSYATENDNTPNGLLLSTSNYKVIKYLINNYKIYDNYTFNFSSVFNSFSSDNLAYFAVNEYLYDKNNNVKDKITYRYSVYADFGGYYKFPRHLATDNQWLTGKELLKIIYKKENGIFKKVQEIENNYLIYNSIPMVNVLLDNLDNFMPLGVEVEKPLSENFTSFPYTRSRTYFSYPYSTGMNLNHYIPDSDVVLGYRTSFLTGGTVDLASTKITEYFDANETVETTTTYDYDYNEHYNLAKTTTTNSLGETVETKYYYPLDSEMSTKPFVDELKDKNMVSVPLVVQSYNGAEKVSEVEAVYNNWNNNLLAPEIIKTSNGALALENRVRYNHIDDTNGNPLEVQQEGGVLISYIWGYNGTLPVAKIENIGYNNIPTNLITDIHNATITTPTNSGAPESVVLLKLEALRNDPALANALVTTYTYKPSVGVSTITDPKGNRITYFYDSFNRLDHVEDKDGNILSKNEYHYKN